MGSALGDGATSADPNVSSSSSSVSPPTPSTSGSTGGQDTASADTARAACVAQVAAAEGVAKAVASSAVHWQQHTDAYLEKIDGRISIAETQKRYAASKAFGLADEKAVAATTKTYVATGTACAGAAKAAPEDKTIGACSTRLAALDVVRTTGTKVQNEWSAHMRMMADKSHTDAGAYHQTWVKAVKGAESSLAAHASAATALTKAPACA